MKILKRIIFRAKNRINQMNIQYQLSLIFTLVSMIGIVLLASLLYRQFVVTLEATAKENNERLIEQVNNQISYYLRNMRQVSDSLYYQVIKKTDFGTDNIDYEMNLMYDQNKESLVSILLVDNQGQLVSATPVSKLKTNINPKEQIWFQTAMSKIENHHFSMPHVQNLFEDTDRPYRWVLSLSQAVELVENGNVKNGVLLVDINYFSMEQLFQNVNFSDSGYVYLTDSNGDIIYHPNQQLLSAGIASENNITSANYKDGSYTDNFNGQKRVVTVKTVGYTGWKIVGVSPMREIGDNYVSFQIIGYVLFIIFVMIFINRFVSVRIADPVNKLEKSVKELESGNLNAKISVSGPYEIQHLGVVVQNMVDQMKNLADEMVAEQKLKQQRELDALQSQINPHFLYNTLDSIVWMLENENTSDAIKMVISLARLFRISLSKGDNIIPLRDELEHAKHYAAIQSLRYKNDYQVIFDTDPETLGLYTIKLIIQPLLENAINHGMMFDDGEIKIKTWKNDDSLYIKISDNGEGMSEDVRRTLLTEERKPNIKSSGIGIRNVDQRIKLLYGSEYGLSIESTLGKGTGVTIRLPIVETKPNN